METSRYNRQMILPEVGTNGQEKLQQAKVLIVGVGGLGVAILPYLVGAGIGEIGIIDHDTIDISNLQRQVIYKNTAVGKSKVLEAKAMADALNPTVKVNAIDEKLTPINALKLFDYYDIMVDATDNLQTKYLINDACCATNKPFVYGSVYKFEGQVSVFNYQNGPTYRCLFPEDKNDLNNCNQTGVMGVSVGIIGMLQANEVLKMVLGIGELLAGKLIIYNMLTNDQQIFEFTKSDILINLSSFEKKSNQEIVLEITAVVALKQINNTSICFLDVRNENELPLLVISNCIQIPLDQLEKSLHLLDTDQTLYVFCQSGIRSKKAVAWLNKNGFKAKNIIEGAQKLNSLLQQQRLSLY